MSEVLFRESFETGQGFSDVILQNPSGQVRKLKSEGRKSEKFCLTNSRWDVVIKQLLPAM